MGVKNQKKNRREFKNRRQFTPTPGETYQNEGGGAYLCLSVSSVTPHKAVMQNVKSGWTVTVCGIGIYDNGTIDWDYSRNDGYFATHRSE